MRFWRCLLVVVLAGLALAGCGPSVPTTPSPSAAIVDSSAPAYPTAAQPKLATTKLFLGPHELSTELALTGIQQQTGMMWRTNLGEMEAMLFVSPRPYQASFWMKNTVLPLSAAYIDPDGTILELHDLQPQNTNAVVAASDRIQFVLEVGQGWFERNKVGVGTVIRTGRGTLRETFFGPR